MPAQLRSGLAFALLTLAPAPLAAQADLPVGRTAEASASDTQPARFRFAAAAAGVLSVAVQGGGDVTLAVTDEDGQLVQEGSSDQDRGGDTGRETLSVILPHPGEYHVVVRQLDASTHPFRIGAAWLAFPPFELPPDPDGRPGLARELAAGDSHEDSLDSAAGDDRDWFTVRATEAGSLVVLTRLMPGEDGDLRIEAWVGAVDDDPDTFSDQDIQGDTGHESVTVNVAAGDVVLIKVTGAMQSTPRVGYRLSTSLIR